MRRRITIGTVVALAAALVAPQAALAAPPPRQTYTVTPLGKPLSDVLVLGGVTAPAPDGSKDVLWVTTGGKPAHLQAIDPLSGAVLANHELSSPAGGYAEGAYAVTATPNGDVYVGTYYDGHLYRRKAGASSTLEDLGQALAGNTYVWRITAGADGKIYGGTYSGGKLFSYDPATNAFRDYGQVIPGEMYARSVAWGDGTVYVGTYNCHIVAVDPVSGAKRELPQPAPNCGHVHDMNVHDGKLFARAATSIINAPLYVYDPATNQWASAPIPNVAGLDTAVGPDGKAYYMHTDGQVGTLSRVDTDTLATEKLAPQVSGRVVNNRGAGWIDLKDPAWPGQTLVQMLWRGAIMRYNLSTGRWDITQSEITGEPIGVWSLAAGEREVYAGGYLNGGLGIYDPATGKVTFNRFAQVESILEDGSNVWLGTYPDARAFVYDRTKVWSNAAYSPGPIGAPENPVLVHDGKSADQVRMPAVADLGDRVVFGTQPGTSLTGTVVVVDKATRTPVVHTGPVTDQSTVALAAGTGGIVYGATSINGAYAQPVPTTTRPHLYALDAATGKARWTVPTRAGVSAVRGLAVDRRGDVWALQNGTITTHNHRNGDLKRTITLTGDTTAGTTWGYLAYDGPRNVMWALVQGTKLYRIDAQTGRSTLVRTQEKVGRLTVQPSTGDVYLSEDADLFVVRAS